MKMCPEESPWFYATILLLMVMIFQAGAWYGSRTPSRGTPAQANNTEKDDCGVATGRSLKKNGDNQYFQGIENTSRQLLGDPEAPVTIVEYTDFRCGFCRRFHNETFPLIKEKYIQTGKVNYKLKHYPLRMNSESLDIANAVECAGEQDKFWQFVVFATKNKVQGSKQSLLEAASQVIVPDTQKFEDCVDSLQYKDRIENHRQQASQQGVSSTPTFFINSEKIRGAQPFAEFKRVIESQLNS